MKDFVAQLSDSLGTFKLNEPLSAYTTWKIGGEADLFITPNGKQELQTIIRLLNEHNIPWYVLGKGSNVLVLDAGFRGAIIHLGAAFSTLEIQDDVVRVGGGYPFVRLGVLVAKQGLTGLEFAGGIPGTVGGAVYMNAGAHGSDTSKVLVEAQILWEDGTCEWMKKDQLEYAYRHSILQKKRGIVLEAVLQLKKGLRSEISEKMAQWKTRRLQTQPLQLACAGSVFRNPLPNHAAQLIEEAGLKGYRIGGAEVSKLHANFIINIGNAKADDVLQLVAHIQEQIQKKYEITLHTEIITIGS